MLAVESDDLNLIPRTYTMQGGPSPASCPPSCTMAHTHTYNLKRYTKLDIKARTCIHLTTSLEKTLNSDQTFAVGQNISEK